MPKSKKITGYFDPNGEDIFNVEKILGKRNRGRRVEYLLKWEGYGNEHNTWEPEKNISPSLIYRYEQSLKANKINEFLCTDEESSSSTSSFASASTTSSSTATINESTKNGLELGLEPEKIVSAGNQNGQLMFAIKWKNTDRFENLPANLIKIQYPQLVIQFYESHLGWKNGTQINYYNPECDKSNQMSYSDDELSFPMQPELIFGSKFDDGELKFLIKWMNSKQPDLVLAKIARKQCPDLVIQFYERKIQWRNQ